MGGSAHLDERSGAGGVERPAPIGVLWWEGGSDERGTGQDGAVPTQTQSIQSTSAHSPAQDTEYVRATPSSQHTHCVCHNVSHSPSAFPSCKNKLKPSCGLFLT